MQEAPNSNVYHFFGDSGQNFSNQQSSGNVYCDDSRLKNETSLASKVKNISGGGVSQLTRHSPHTFSLGQTDSFNHREAQDVEHQLAGLVEAQPFYFDLKKARRKQIMS